MYYPDYVYEDQELTHSKQAHLLKLAIEVLNEIGYALEVSELFRMGTDKKLKQIIAMLEGTL